MSTCAEIAAKFIREAKETISNEGYYTLSGKSLIDAFQQCSDFPKPKVKIKKEVWQWRYKGSNGKFWMLIPDLMTDEPINKSVQWEKHAGPFFVDED